MGTFVALFEHPPVHTVQQYPILPCCYDLVRSTTPVNWRLVPPA